MKKMRTFRLDKLVRDGIVGSTVGQGGEVEVRKLSGDEKKRALAAKIVEEARELGAAGTVEELADLREALDQYAVEIGASEEDITKVQAEKRVKIGGFAMGDYVEAVTLPEDNEWAVYYASNPDRFPEITHE